MINGCGQEGCRKLLAEEAVVLLDSSNINNRHGHFTTLSARHVSTVSLMFNFLYHP